jgi:hypothetical protein
MVPLERSRFEHRAKEYCKLKKFISDTTETKSGKKPQEILNGGSTIYIFVSALNTSVSFSMLITSKVPLCFFLVLFQIQLGHCMSNQHSNWYYMHINSLSDTLGLNLYIKKIKSELCKIFPKYSVVLQLHICKLSTWDMNGWMYLLIITKRIGTTCPSQHITFGCNGANFEETGNFSTFWS